MLNETYRNLLNAEVIRIDSTGTSKRNEKVIEGFARGHGAPRAMIGDTKFLVFNSNDYLGLRFHPALIAAEEAAVAKYGAGPGAVRFISGTMKVHRELEAELARFHAREDAIIFSSAFAVNMAVLHCLIKGQSRDSVIGPETLVVSDELNHRSIIDGIRVAGLLGESKAIFRHMDISDLRRVLAENQGKFKRVVVVTDGIFSMLGEQQDLAGIQKAAGEFDYEQGIITVVDDSHGTGAFGATGRGCEEECGTKCDLLISTLGKAFGADGGYVTGDKVMMDYLRESAATYIYSNPVSPGTAAAGLAALKIVDSAEGRELLSNLKENIAYFKQRMAEQGFTMAAPSRHPIQPLLIGDAAKARALTDALYADGVLVTNISFPVVPKGRDEIRVQISASHTRADLDEFIGKLQKAGKELGLIKQ